MSINAALRAMATHAAVQNRAAPDSGTVYEGLVIPGSWIASEGVCMVVIGDTIGFESPFFADGNSPITPICRLVTHQIGDQYAPVGGERVHCWEGMGGWLCEFYHGPDDTSQVPSGERWIQHRSQAAVMRAVQGAGEMDSGEGSYDSGIGGFDLVESEQDQAPSIVWDTSLKLTNDGPTSGDGLGGAILGGKGALTQSQTASGARSTIDDTAQKIESVTAGGLTSGQYDQVKQIVASVVAGQLESIIDGIAERITHQASESVLQQIDAVGKTITLKVPNLAGGGSIGLGDFFENLPSASGAINEDILSTFGSNVNTFGLSNLIQFANLLHAAGTVTSGQLVTILTALIPAWIAKVGVPAGSGVVRIAS